MILDKIAPNTTVTKAAATKVTFDTAKEIVKNNNKLKKAGESQAVFEAWLRGMRSVNEYRPWNGYQAKLLMNASLSEDLPLVMKDHYKDFEQKDLTLAAMNDYAKDHCGASRTVN